MKKILALLIAVFSLLNCTNDKPLPNGYDLLDRDNKVGLLPPVTLRPTRTAIFRQNVPAGGKGSLLLGVGKETQSFIILNCRNLLKVDTTNTLVSTTLAMRAEYVLGDKLPFNVTAHRVTQSWDEATVVWDDVQNAFMATPLESFEIVPGDTAWLKLPFSDLNFMNEWIKDAFKETEEMQVYGLVLKFDQATGGLVLSSSEDTAYSPYFEVVTQDSAGALDTTVAVLSHDASLLQNTAGVEEETNPAVLKVGDASGYRSLLFFNLSDIPKEATIHKALLTLYVEPAELWVPEDSTGSTFSVAARAVVRDSLWSSTEDSVLIDSEGLVAMDVASGSNNTFAFDSQTPALTMSRIVQRWVAAPKDYPNYGLMLSPYFQATDFLEMAFKNSQTDTTIMPTLVITYSMPAAHRFARQ